MTKRRPSWSDRWRWVAAIACGLLLLNASSAVWAASKKPSGKPVVSKKSKAANRHVRRVAAPETSLVAAEMMDDGNVGLHGKASFYGRGFQGRKTSTGERFDVRQFTAASNHFPLGSLVAVRRLDSDRCAIVKVNDRMAARHRQRVIDVSRGVAEYLDMVKAGVVLVRVAPLKDVRAEASCRSAFEPDAECASCGRPPRLPDFGELNID